MKAFYQKFTLFIFLVTLVFSSISCKKKEVNYADTTPPRVVSTYPANGATDVSVNIDKIEIDFSEDIDSSSATFASLKMNKPIYGTIRIKENKLVISPFYPLEYDTRYKITVTTKVTDLFGNHLKSPYTFSFTTEHDTIPPPPPMFFSNYFITNQNPFLVGGVKQAGSGIKVNGQVYVPIDNSTDFSLQLPLNEGKNTFTTVAFDKAGNMSTPVTLTVVLDTTPPSQPTVNYPLKTRDEKVLITGFKDSDSEVSVYTQSNNYQVCIDSSSNEKWQCSLNVVEEGRHCFYIVASDAAGNTTNGPTFCIERDITPPVSFSIDATSSTSTFGMFNLSGNKEINSFVFLNDSQLISVSYDSTNWETSVPLKNGFNILNFSLTDDVYNSSQFIYTFYHDSSPLYLENIYPTTGTYSTPITGFYLTFSREVTLSGKCGVADFIIPTEGNGSLIIDMDKIKLNRRNVWLPLQQNISGNPPPYRLNPECFMSKVPADNPPWWHEYPVVATYGAEIDGLIEVTTTTQNYYSSSPKPSSTNPVSQNCSYYSCEVTVAPFYASSGSEEGVRIAIKERDKLLGSQNSNFSPVTFDITDFLKPFSCPQLTLLVTNARGTRYTYPFMLTPEVYIYSLPVTVNNVDNNYYAKKVTGDWDGDGYLDLAISIIKTPTGSYPSRAFVILFKTGPGGGIENYKIISLGTAGYGISVSYGEVNDQLVLTDPEKGNIGFFNWANATTQWVQNNEIKWIPLRERLGLKSNVLVGLDIANIGNIIGQKNVFAIATDNSSGDNLFVTDKNLDILSSTYIKSLDGSYKIFEKGKFATEGQNSPSLCVSNYTYKAGRVICYYKYSEFPQSYPYFSVTDSSPGAFYFGYKLLLTDLNGDGMDDLVIGEYGRKLSIYLGGDYPDEHDDLDLNFPLGFSINSVKFKKKNFLLLPDQENGKLDTLGFSPDLKGIEKFTACINGRDLSNNDRIIQISGRQYLLFKYSEGKIKLFLISY